MGDAARKHARLGKTMQARIAELADRGVVRVAGEDAGKLLQGVITGDMDLLARQPAIHAALLTPQGKVLFEFFVAKTADGYLLETGADQAAALAKRLAMYRLRAKATIEDASTAYRVLALWGSSAQSPSEAVGAVSFADPRLPALGHRILAEAAHASVSHGADATAADYHAHRVALGVPEAGKDYPLGDTFPHEADLDQLAGVSFSKGCFVGQEVVSRMQHRTSVRKRVVPIEAIGPGVLATGSDITFGTATIGKVGSVAGRRALAMLRLDRAAEAAAKGEPLLAGGVEIAMRKPEWATFDLAPASAAETS
jgi:tRNA-modifying protein YgfZ